MTGGGRSGGRGGSGRDGGGRGARGGGPPPGGRGRFGGPSGARGVGGGRPDGGRFGRSGPRPAPRTLPPVEEGEIEIRLLEAREIADYGDLKSALAAAGEAVRLATERPEGYLVLGDLNLAFGDLLEAERSYAAALAKAGAAIGDPREIRRAATVGAARLARLRGDFATAAKSYRDALAVDPEDPDEIGGEAAEMLLLAGDVDAAKRLVPPPEDASPDEHLAAFLVLRRTGDAAEACVRARLALFGNLYLLAALMDEAPPELGLVHGFPEAQPEFATDVAERVKPLFEADAAALDDLAAWASTPTVAAEVGEFVATAKALMSEPDPERRRAGGATLARMRDLARLRATAPRVLEEAAADAGAGECGEEPAAFPV